MTSWAGDILALIGLVIVASAISRVVFGLLDTRRNHIDVDPPKREYPPVGWFLLRARIRLAWAILLGRVKIGPHHTAEDVLIEQMTIEMKRMHDEIDVLHERLARLPSNVPYRD